MTIADGPTGLVIDGPATPKTYPRGLKLNNFWNRDIVAIDSTKGTLRLYSVAPRVRETVTIGKTSFPAWPTHSAAISTAMSGTLIAADCSESNGSCVTDRRS